VQTKKLAHLSDLHLGKGEAVRRRAEALCARLIDDEIDHVVVTGDVTNRGRFAEWALFIDAFAPLFDSGRLTIVPGNHDHLDDDIASFIMDDRRVDVVHRPGLMLVRVDSTAPHNRFLIAGHGAICDRVIADCTAALDDAPPDTLRVVLLHHHVLPAPVETFPEVLADLVYLPFANELALGARLLEQLRDRCDLVLHGHRHVPSALELPSLHGDAPLGVYNAGSSTELGGYRVFRHLAGVRAPASWTHLAEVHHAVPVDPVPVRILDRARPVPRAARGARLASA
jgi:3',5'-cyclic AMP phosphodiesterase CpdA